tara:strand:- start:5424 stop:5681 length:258 start_codon:yes stop_codon:yes gene_type:complete
LPNFQKGSGFRRVDRIRFAACANADKKVLAKANRLIDAGFKGLYATGNLIQATQNCSIHILHVCMGRGADYSHQHHEYGKKEFSH